MLKLLIAFIAFAAVALYILSRGGDIDMSGEKHGIESHEPAASASSAAAPPMPAASAAETAASR